MNEGNGRIKLLSIKFFVIVLEFFGEEELVISNLFNYFNCYL